MQTRTWFIENESAMVALGELLGRALATIPSGFTVFLTGDLGAGKTTLARGILRAFGHQGAVKSPTYTLVEAYELPSRTLYHFDLYRLGNPEELEYMGIRDYFHEMSIALVEWPARGEGCLPQPDWQITVSVSGQGRNLVLTACSALGQQALPD